MILMQRRCEIRQQVLLLHSAFTAQECCSKSQARKTISKVGAMQECYNRKMSSPHRTHQGDAPMSDVQQQIIQPMITKLTNRKHKHICTVLGFQVDIGARRHTKLALLSAPH